MNNVLKSLITFIVITSSSLSLISEVKADEITINVDGYYFSYDTDNNNSSNYSKKKDSYTKKDLETAFKKGYYQGLNNSTSYEKGYEDGYNNGFSDGTTSGYNEICKYIDWNICY